MKKTSPKEKDRTRIVIVLLMLITLLSLTLSAYMLLFHKPQRPIMPDYMPVEQDEHVSTIPPEYLEETKMDIPEGGGGAIIICDTEITAHLDTGKVDMLYRNPDSSASAVVLQLWIGDTLVAQSGSVYPGYQLEDMYLLDTSLLQEGGYRGIVKVAFYDPASCEKAIVDTDIEVAITVVP